MPEYQVTFNSEKVMAIRNYTADSVGEAIDEACDEEMTFAGAPSSVEITILTDN